MNRRRLTLAAAGLVALLVGGAAYAGLPYANVSAQSGKMTLSAAAATLVPTASLNGRSTLAIQNLDSQPFYCGPDVSAGVHVDDTTGWQVAANGGTYTAGADFFSSRGTVKIYCYSTAGTAADKLRWQELAH